MNSAALGYVVAAHVVGVHGEGGQAQSSSGDRAINQVFGEQPLAEEQFRRVDIRSTIAALRNQSLAKAKLQKIMST